MSRKTLPTDDIIVQLSIIEGQIILKMFRTQSGTVLYFVLSLWISKVKSEIPWKKENLKNSRSLL